MLFFIITKIIAVSSFVSGKYIANKALFSIIIICYYINDILMINEYRKNESSIKKNLVMMLHLLVDIIIIPLWASIFIIDQSINLNDITDNIGTS